MSFTVDGWLRQAIADAERRGLPELTPLLEALARSTAALRAADDAHRADQPGAAGAGAPPAR
jgi:hypothetical protein